MSIAFDRAEQILAVYDPQYDDVAADRPEDCAVVARLHSPELAARQALHSAGLPRGSLQPLEMAGDGTLIFAPSWATNQPRLWARTRSMDEKKLLASLRKADLTKSERSRLNKLLANLPLDEPGVGEVLLYVAGLRPNLPKKTPAEAAKRLWQFHEAVGPPSTWTAFDHRVVDVLLAHESLAKWLYIGVRNRAEEAPKLDLYAPFAAAMKSRGVSDAALDEATFEFLHLGFQTGPVSSKARYPSEMTQAPSQITSIGRWVLEQMISRPDAMLKAAKKSVGRRSLAALLACFAPSTFQRWVGELRLDKTEHEDLLVYMVEAGTDEQARAALVAADRVTSHFARFALAQALERRFPAERSRGFNLVEKSLLEAQRHDQVDDWGIRRHIVEWLLDQEAPEAKKILESVTEVNHSEENGVFQLMARRLGDAADFLVPRVCKEVEKNLRDTDRVCVEVGTTYFYRVLSALPHSVLARQQDVLWHELAAGPELARNALARLLGRIPPAALVPAARKALGAKESAVRHTAVRALGFAATPEARALLEAARKSEADRQVLAALKAALAPAKAAKPALPRTTYAFDRYAEKVETLALAAIRKQKKVPEPIAEIAFYLPEFAFRVLSVEISNPFGDSMPMALKGLKTVIPLVDEDEDVVDTILPRFLASCGFDPSLAEDGLPPWTRDHGRMPFALLVRELERALVRLPDALAKAGLPLSDDVHLVVGGHDEELGWDEEMLRMQVSTLAPAVRRAFAALCYDRPVNQKWLVGLGDRDRARDSQA